MLLEKNEKTKMTYTNVLCNKSVQMTVAYAFYTYSMTNSIVSKDIKVLRIHIYKIVNM